MADDARGGRADERALPADPRVRLLPAHVRRRSRCRVTERFSARELTLPLHPALSVADVDRVVAALATLLDATADLDG